MSDNVKRWHPMFGTSKYMHEKNGGDFVLSADFDAAMAAKDAEIAELKTKAEINWAKWNYTEAEETIAAQQAEIAGLNQWVAELQVDRKRIVEARAALERKVAEQDFVHEVDVRDLNETIEALRFELVDYEHTIAALKGDVAALLEGLSEIEASSAYASNGLATACLQAHHERTAAREEAT